MLIKKTCIAHNLELVSKLDLNFAFSQIKKFPQSLYKIYLGLSLYITKSHISLRGTFSHQLISDEQLNFKTGVSATKFGSVLA